MLLFSPLHTCMLLLNWVQLFATPWTICCQAPRALDVPGKSPGVDCHFLHQGIFPIIYSLFIVTSYQKFLSIWASLVTQAVKNSLAMWETWVQSLSWEDPLEEGMATHSSILAWRIPMDRAAWWATVHGVAKRQT